MRPVNDEHLYLARRTPGMPYPPVAINDTPRPAGSGSSRRRDNGGALVAHKTNSEPQVLAPSVISSSPIATETGDMQTDILHNAGVLHPAGSSHPLAPELSILSQVSTIQSNVRYHIRL